MFDKKGVDKYVVIGVIGSDGPWHKHNVWTLGWDIINVKLSLIIMLTKLSPFIPFSCHFDLISMSLQHVGFCFFGWVGEKTE